jgi:hypothetical protein
VKVEFEGNIDGILEEIGNFLDAFVSRGAAANPQPYTMGPVAGRIEGDQGKQAVAAVPEKGRRGRPKKAKPEVEAGTSKSVGSGSGDAAGMEVTDTRIPEEAGAGISTPVLPAAAAVEAIKNMEDDFPDKFPSLGTAQTAMSKFYSKLGAQAALDTLARYGVKKVKELKPEQRKEFIEECFAKLEGE